MPNLFKKPINSTNLLYITSLARIHSSTNNIIKEPISNTYSIKKII